jgi:hypothetical protein
MNTDGNCWQGESLRTRRRRSDHGATRPATPFFIHIYPCPSVVKNSSRLRAQNSRRIKNAKSTRSIAEAQGRGINGRGMFPKLLLCRLFPCLNKSFLCRCDMNAETRRTRRTAKFLPASAKLCVLRVSAFCLPVFNPCLSVSIRGWTEFFQLIPTSPMRWPKSED